MSDARFEDVPFSDRPLKLGIETPADVPVVAALVQDAVCRTGDLAWLPKRRRFTLLMNRFRWEDREAAEKGRRPFERVRSILVLDSVLSAKSRGIERGDGASVLELLTIEFKPATEPEGTIVLTFAGGGDMLLEVECLEGRLADLTRPWEARAAAVPDHDV